MRAVPGLLRGVCPRYWPGIAGCPLSGYMPIRTEIDPLPAMAEASAYGPVGVPVIQALVRPLKFSRWTPEGR